jgi:diguanylate cyclase (GGDEF)-like protein
LSHRVSSDESEEGAGLPEGKVGAAALPRAALLRLGHFVTTPLGTALALATAATASVAGFAALGLATRGPLLAGVHFPAAVIAAGIVVAGVFEVPIRLTRRGPQIRLHYRPVPLVAGMLLLAPGTLLAAVFAGELVACVLRRRLDTTGARSVATRTIGATLAMMLALSLIGSASVFRPAAWALLASSALVAEAIPRLADVVHARRAPSDPVVAGEEPAGRELGIALGVALLVAVIGSGIGVIVALIVTRTSDSALLLACLASALLVLHLPYWLLWRREVRVEALQRFDRVVGPAVSSPAEIALLLESVRELLRCRSSRLVPPGLVEELDIAASGTSGDMPPGRSARSENRLVTALLGEEHLSVALADRTRPGSLEVSGPLGRPGFSVADRLLLESLAERTLLALQRGSLVTRLDAESERRLMLETQDPVSGLPNRSSLLAFLGELGRSSAPTATAVIAVAVDNFDEVSNSLGLHNGDLVLHSVGQRLLSLLPTDAFPAHTRTAQFMAVVGGLESPEAALVLIEHFAQVLSAPVILNGFVVEVSISVGAALYPLHGVEPSSLVRRAEVALEAARTSSTRSALYDARRDRFSPRRLALVGELRQAIEDHALQLHYQPICSMTDGSVGKVEALVRWPHPVRGLLPPSAFIGVAEQSGLLRPMTRWVLEEAARQCATWAKDYGVRIGVAVNLSPKSLTDMTIAFDVAEALRRSAIPPGLLTLELTEDSILADLDRSLAVLARLSGLGIMLAIDDFGVGYSSLSYLHRLPVDEVKIDRSFVVDMDRNHNDAVIVRSIIDLAHNLGLRSVAEGIETSTSMERLIALGCDFGQGFYLGQPMSPHKLVDWLLADVDAKRRRTLPTPASPASRHPSRIGDLRVIPGSGTNLGPV